MRNPLTTLGLTVAVLLGAVACNPIVTDTESLGGELDQTAVRYAGPAGSWLDAAVTGSAGRTVYGFALISNADLRGPTARSCGGDPVPACVATPSDLRMTQQRIVPEPGTAPVRLMTVWSGERIQVVLVCVEPVTEELGCPPTLRLVLRATDDGGAPAGVLGPADASAPSPT